MTRRIDSTVRVANAAVAAAMLLAAIGCQPSQQFVPISGRVEVDGVPLNTGAIIVVPDVGRPAAGKITADGRFTLSTNSSGDGTVPGTHRVIVTAFREDGQSRQWLVPAVCREIPTTPLRLRVDGPDVDVVVRIETLGQSHDVERFEPEGGVNDVP